MSLTKPVLYIFAISHYCEKARWALDHHDIDFDINHVAPGFHVALAKQLGAKRSSVPILCADGRVIQGSAAIVDWADAAGTGAKCLTPEGFRDECVALEKRLDDVVGVHVRRYYYSEALLEHPQTVKPMFAGGLGFAQKMLLGATWGAVRKVMAKSMDLGPEQGQASRRIVAAELDWLDGLLSDGRQFLVGETLSRADIAAASLLAPLAAPSQHPAYANLVVPPGVAADLLEWEKRPVTSWVRGIYARHRLQQRFRGES